MKKQVICKKCNGIGHYAITCTKYIRIPSDKPIKVKQLKRTSKKNLQIVDKSKPKKPKPKTRSYYVKQLDKIFSQYIRQKDAINGISTCVTCSDQKPYQQHQCGHYYSRSHYSTRWDETNCHVQCIGCNMFKHGAYTEYALFMINKYGIDYVKELDAKSKQTVKISTVEIKELIEFYKQKLL